MTSATEISTELRLKRVFAAPQKIVFDAWTNPEMLAHWWGPRGFTSAIYKLDARNGGAIHLHMRGPNGMEHPMTGEFVEIDRPYKLVFTSAALDVEGKPIFINRNTVTFTGVPQGTEIDLHVEVISSTTNALQYLKGMEQGWTSSLDRLAELVVSAK
jgi:uncharacterized protein YndB with AHSA1/START domain